MAEPDITTPEGDMADDDPRKGMVEVARLQVLGMTVTCHVARDGSKSYIRRSEIHDGVTEHVIEDETVDGCGFPALRLFDHACNNALSRYTRSEWTGSLSSAGVEI